MFPTVHDIVLGLEQGPVQQRKVHGEQIPDQHLGSGPESEALLHEKIGNTHGMRSAAPGGCLDIHDLCHRVLLVDVPRDGDSSETIPLSFSIYADKSFRIVATSSVD
jgi:hypothetical protein